MKKSFFLILLVIATTVASAQRARLNAYGAYVFDDKFDSYYDPYNYYNGKINGGGQWGLGIEYMLQPKYCLEVMWIHQSTHAPTYYWDGTTTINEKYSNFDLNIDYALIGGDGHFQAPDVTFCRENIRERLVTLQVLRRRRPAPGNASRAVRDSEPARLSPRLSARRFRDEPARNPAS